MSDEVQQDDIVLLDQKLEDRFFRALLQYDKLPRLVKDQISERDFSSNVKARLFKLLMFHWENFGSTPEHDILRIEAEEMFGGSSVTMIDRYLTKIEDIPVPEWDWIVARIDRWIKTIRLHKAMFVANDQLRKRDLEAAQTEVLNAIRHGGIVRTGAHNELELDEDEILDVVDQENLICCPTRIYALDKVIHGVFREELFIIMAALNVGKTWAACHFGQSGLMSGLGVLHLSFEMNRQRVLQRYMQMFSGMVRPRDRNETYREVPIWDEHFEGMELRKTKTLLHIGELKDQMDNMRAFGGLLRVKHHPSGSPTIEDIEREILLFDTSFNKPPDLVIVDGLTNMDTGSKSNDKRHVYSRNAEQLRRMAGDYSCGMIATHQANREGMSAEVVDSEHTGEALDIMRTADTGISINQSRKEAALKKCRVFLMRARNARRWQMIEVYQNLDIGQFCHVSRLITDEEAEEEAEQSRDRPNMPEGDRIRRRLDNKRRRGGR